MAKNAYVGVSGVARKVKSQYVGVNGVARKVTKGYVGVNGVARLCFQSMALAVFMMKGYDFAVTINDVTINNTKDDYGMAEIGRVAVDVGKSYNVSITTPWSFTVDCSGCNYVSSSYNTGTLTITSENPTISFNIFS